MLFKVAYIGKGFHGSQTQPDKRTVEGELNRALAKMGVAAKGKLLSRTDAGVSALWNIFSVDADKGISPNWLNANLPDDIFILGISRGEMRLPARKQYTYLLHGKRDAEAVKRIREASKLFVGTHDFRNFSRKDDSKEGKTTVRRIERIAVRKTSSGLAIDFHGTGFLWEMIRRIVTSITDYGEGRIGKKDIAVLLSGRETNKKPGPAPPENLILVKCDCGARFTKGKSGNGAVLKRKAEEKFSVLSAGLEVAKAARKSA